MARVPLVRTRFGLRSTHHGTAHSHNVLANHNRLQQVTRSVHARTCEYGLLEECKWFLCAIFTKCSRLVPYFSMCSRPAFPNICGAMGLVSKSLTLNMCSTCLSIGFVRSVYLEPNEPRSIFSKPSTRTHPCQSKHGTRTHPPPVKATRRPPQSQPRNQKWQPQSSCERQCTKQQGTLRNAGRQRVTQINSTENAKTRAYPRRGRTVRCHLQ